MAEKKFYFLLVHEFPVLLVSLPIKSGLIGNRLVDKKSYNIIVFYASGLPGTITGFPWQFRSLRSFETMTIL